MDSWTLQGDSYSFLRSAPRTFSLCHREGTPNHVEIFDIINVPTQRSAISETTCLCDIFGDNCESPSLSSSPAVGTFVPSQREIDETAAASPLVDELNDSSSSYHTAQGSSEGEEGCEDSRERVCSPLFQNVPSERKHSEGVQLDIYADTSNNCEPKSNSPVPELNTANPSPGGLDSSVRTPSPGHNSPNTLSSEGRVSSLSSSSLEKRLSPSSPYPRPVDSETESREITPSFPQRYNSPLHESLTPSTSSESRNYDHPSSPHSMKSSPEFMVAEVSPEPRSYFNQHDGPLSEPTFNNFSIDCTEPAFDSRAIKPSPEPSPTCSVLSSQSKETLLSPELKNRPDSPDTQPSSPFPEQGGRISLPDLFSRGSSPDIEDVPCSPELISAPSPEGRDCSPTTENAPLTPEPVRTVSTPSPAISTATSSELVQSSVSPILRHKTPSPGLFSAASSCTTGTRTPSPKITHISISSEIRTLVPSPVTSYSLTQSPEVRSSCSPKGCIYTAPSPEIRVTGSSPDMSRRDQTSEADTMSASPPLETHFDSFSSRSPTSSPHITGISYTVVQPEDRDTPLFPELSHLSSPEGRITTPNRDIIEGSIAESAGASQNSPHASGSTHSEITLTHPTRYQTPSPQAKHHTPSPESTYNTPLCKTYQSPSPEHMSGDLSPIVSPEQRFYQHSPTSSSTEYNLQYMQPNVHPRHTPESDRDVFAVDLTEIQNPDNNSPSYELDSNGKSVVTEIKISSPVQAIQSPVSISPFTSEVKEDSSHKQLSQEREATLTEVQKKSSLPLFPETEQDTSFNQKDIYKKSFDVKCTSPDCIVVKDKNINTSPVNRAMSSSPVQEIIQPYCVTSEMSSLSKSTCASKQQRRQFSNNDRSENRERFIDNMTHHVNKRRTPSPPLTRFTPVHILAPEKPYRQWQNRSHSSSQVVAFSPSGKLKKDVTNRESPSAPGDSNSHDHWVRLGRQLDMEQKMQLEDEREVHRERQGDREIDRERKREEQVPEKGGVRRGDTSYRGEQVELSFNARNRKGPVSRNTAPTSREILLGLPAVHSYSESLPATRQLQQQQNLLRLASQQDTRVGGPGRGLKPSASQNKKSSPGNVAASRPCRSSSSSMGSELDEADNEVKWFTDVAFRSLSSPEVDYLDMYNSSHRSSTNISQPSTEESPAGVSASLLAYADFRGSAPKLDNDELSFQQPTAHYSDGLDPSRRYEMGSFECVDVAIEREDFRKVRRGVPKRQIQLKRRNANTEGKQDESSEKSSPGVPRTQGSPSPGSQSMEKFTRQHSTPAAMQDCYQSVENLEPTLQNERKSKLQKSLSLDETGSKTKMATCLIKSVLSKKMQNVDKQTDEQTGEEESPDFEQKSPSAVAPLKDSSKRDVCNDVSHLRGESRTMGETKPGKGFGVRSSSRPSSSSSSKSVTFSHTGSEEADSQDTNATSLKSEVRSELKVPFDIQTSRAEVQLADDHKLWDKREAGDSANATPQNTGVPFNIEARQQIITTDQECQNAEGRKQLQRDEYKSKTQETASKTVEKKKTSLNVCLTPEAENKPEASSANVLFTEKEDTTEISSDKTEEEEEGNGTIKAKVPIHKVRDVRRIVKNTYNLSFKATTAASPEVNEEKMENCNVEKNLETKKERQNGILKGEEKELSQEMWREEREEKKEEMKVEKKEEQREVVEHITPPPPLQSKGKTSSHPQPIQIEYKAVCKKESAYLSDKTQASPELVTELSRGSQQSSNATIQNYTTQDAGIANVAGGTESAPEICKVPGTRDKSVVIRTDRKPPMLGSLPRVPSKEREVSTAVVIIRDGSSKTKTASSLSQEDATAPFQAAAVSPIPGPNSTGCAPSNSGHSVSMLLKEKGYHADIGAVMGDGQSVAGRKAVLPKHVNSLEIPLQIAGPAEGGQVESHRQRTFSSSSNMSDNTDTLSKTREGSKPAVKETSKQKRASPLRNVHEQAPPMAKQKELGDFEAVKRLDPTFPPRSPALRRFKPQPIEVKSLSKETQKDEMPSPGNTRPQTIEVKSIAKNSQKPTVPPKPTCKFKPSDLGVTASEGQRPPATSSVSVKPQDEERSQTIVVSSPTIYRKISNESLSTPNYTRKLAVSAVSSLKPPPSKTTATTVSSLSKQSPGPSETEACIGRGEQQQVAASPQSSRNTQRLPTSPTAPTSVTDPGASINSVQATVSDATANQVPGPAAATACQPSQSAVMDADNQQQYTRTARPQEQAMPATSNNTKQVPGYTQQSSCRSLSSERPQRSDDLHFYTSDDPPSYDERESFSPLILPDLTPRRSTRYQPSSSPPPCSCTASRPSHPGVTPPHHHRSPHEPTPPVPTHSPGQALPYPMAQPPLRPHQCRPDHQPISYQHVSPKSLPLGPGHPPTLYPPLHQPPPCPPHPSLLQTCPADRPLQPAQHIDPRRPPVHRSPQQQLPVMAGTHYNDPGHSHSPGLPPMDPQYLCGPSTLGPAYGSEYGGDSSSLYSEGSYGQTPRRVLMDPETGKYFYIEMPVQPLRKMLFDPETGQYVEVLIPQQAVSHSGLYPPAAAPYPSLHNPSMYASAPQYMPYAAPPPPAHPQSQPQPPRYPEAPATATMHASGSGISFRNPSGQGSKPEPQNHPPLDQSYLESMYYVPTGMNASPNPTPPDYYHKRPPNLPPTGGKRS